MTDVTPNIVPFGKYKGLPIEELLIKDPNYLQWLTSQDWFRAKFVTLHQVIINRGAEPEETPAHNALQVRFLDDEFCRRFLRRAVPDFDAKIRRELNAAREANLKLITEKIASIERRLEKIGQPRQGPYRELDQRERDGHNAMLARLRDMQTVFSDPIERCQFKIESREFEERGIDVSLCMSVGSKAHVLPEDLPQSTFAMDGPFGWWNEVRRSWHFAIEIKPAVGDDYPAVLRQMKTNRSTILFLDQYTGTGATREQFIKTFATASMQVIFADDVEPGDRLHGGKLLSSANAEWEHHMRSKTVRAKRSQSIDLEYGFFDIEKGKTYTDDGTTIFDVYLDAGLADGSFELTQPGPSTIVVSHPESRKRRR